MRTADCKYAHDLNDQTAAQVMLANIGSGYPSATGSDQTAGATEGYGAPTAAPGTYGGADGGAAGYGGGSSYAAPIAAPGTESHPAPTPSADGSAADASMASSRKRARDAEEGASPEGAEGSAAEDAARPPRDSTDDSTPHEPAGDERPSKQHKASHADEENVEDKNGSDLTSSATRGPDGKSLEPSGIPGVEGGPDPQALASNSNSLSEVGGLIDAGTARADAQPGESSGGPSLTSGGQPGGGEGGAAGGPGGP